MAKLNYEALWKLMSDLVADLRKSGGFVPPQVMRDLRAAKTMIEIVRMDRSRSENLLRIDEYLANVESYLVPAAKRRLGQEYVDAWMDKLAEAQRSVQMWEMEAPRRLPVGVPRDKRWVRIKPSEEAPIEKIERLSEEMGLGHRIQEDGYVLVYGEEDEVKEFVKKTAELLRESGR